MGGFAQETFESKKKKSERTSAKQAVKRKLFHYQLQNSSQDVDYQVRQW